MPDEPDVVPLVDACAVKGGVKFGDYQWLVHFFYPCCIHVKWKWGSMTCEKTYTQALLGEQNKKEIWKKFFYKLILGNFYKLTYA